MIGRFYLWFWFHTEFWLTPLDRRPYTFIWRDWIYPHAGSFAIMVVFWYAGTFALLAFYRWIAAILLLLSSALIAHLVWGSQWIEGQQEVPTYLGDEEGSK
jgi:hypothetical protein